jgi:hypothetical protein
MTVLQNVINRGVNGRRVGAELSKADERKEMKTERRAKKKAVGRSGGMTGSCEEEEMMTELSHRLTHQNC